MRTIFAKDYIAEKMGNGLFTVLVALGSNHAVEEVNLDCMLDQKRYQYGLTDGYSLIVGGYGSRIKDVQGAMVLNDGRVLACISSKEGSHTFGSGELEVNYYMLTPNKNENDKTVGR